MSSTCCLKCSRPYRDPRMLSCCHSFCTQCIQSLVAMSVGTTSIICPTCLEKTLVFEKGVTSLPRSLHLFNKQSNILAKITSTPPPPCDSCSEGTSIAYCTECTDLLCKDCWNAHKKLRMSRTHTSFTLEEARTMPQDKLTKLIPSFTQTCHDHNDQQLNYYCEQCIIPVCSECTLSNHKDHPFTEISKQVEKKKTDVHAAFQGLQKAEQQLQVALASGEEIKREIKTCQDNIDTDIRRAFATIQQHLRQREESMLAQSREMTNGNHLSPQLEEIQHLLDAMMYCHSLATSVIGEYNDVELLSVAHTLQARAKQLQDKFSNTSLKIVKPPTPSVEINIDEVTTKIENLGIIFAYGSSPNNTFAEIPSHIVVDREFTVKVVSRDRNGKELFCGGETVDGKLVPVEDKGTTDDSHNGTYLVSIKPQRFGQQKLSLTIRGHPIKDSPFNLCVSRDYTIIKKPLAIHKEISKPFFIAHASNGDMFVTSYNKHCICVCDSTGKLKTTIGSSGTGPVKFDHPTGIAINGNTIYVAEECGNRIHKLTLEGEHLSTFGEKGSSKMQFSKPWAICIGPDGRIYVADNGNNRIQVFHCDDTFSHIIDDKIWNIGDPGGLVFDLSGQLHVTDQKSNVVNVITAEGQFVRKYGQPDLKGPRGITIDPAGNSLVVNYNGCSLAIFNPSGTHTHSIGDFYYPIGVAVASNGSVWVADTYKNKLVEY